MDFTLSSSDGTAQAPEDYVALELAIRFSPDNGNRRCLQLTIVDDWRLEDDEILSLTLTSTDPSISLGPGQSSVTIIDNDQVTAGLQQAYYTFDETVRQAELTVVLLGDVERDVSVMLESRDGTAIASDEDYIAFSEVLIFSRGSNAGSTRTVTVQILDDPLVERSEFFTAHTSSLDAGVQIQPGKENVTVYIISDDGKLAQALNDEPVLCIAIMFVL